MKKSYFVFLALMLVLVVLTGCRKKPELKVSWGGPKNISMTPIIAAQKGYFQEEGLNVETKYLQTGKIAMDALLSKDTDFSVLVESNVAFIKYQPGADIQVICSIEEKFDDAIVARKDKGINTPKDLEGRTLAVLIGTTSHIFADRFIRYHNLDASKINIINLSPPSIQASIMTGDIEAGSIWQPYRYNVQKAIGEKAIQFNDKEIYKAYAIMAVRKEFAEKNGDIIKGFLRALIKAENYIRSHKNEAISILAKEMNIDPEVLSAVWDEYIIRVRLDDELQKLIKEEGNWIKETQRGFENKAVPSYEGVINASFLREVDPNKVVGSSF